MNTKDLAHKYANEVAEECLAQRLRAVGRIVSNLYDGELAGCGLTASQFGILAASLKLGTASQNKIAEVHRVEKSTLSRNLKLMEESGWIKLERRGRNVDVEVTKGGKDIFCKSVDRWRKAQADLKRHLRNKGVDAVEMLAATLAKV
jgi:DNA-binding MarR family transcriptional regulator